MSPVDFKIMCMFESHGALGLWRGVGLVLSIFFACAVQVEARFTITLTSNTDICDGDDISLSCAGGFGSLLWSVTGLGGEADVVKLTTERLNSHHSGRYNGTSTHVTTCPCSSSRITILGITANESKATVTCQDNPSRDRFGNLPPISSARLTLANNVSIGPPNCTFTPLLGLFPNNITCGLNVTWTAPTCVSGWLSSNTAMAYSVTVDPLQGGNVGAVLKITTTSFLIVGLSPNTNYSIHTALTNGCGIGTNRTVTGITGACGQDIVANTPPKWSSSNNCSIAIAAGVSAAVVVSSLISICITYLIIRKRGQQNGGQPDKMYYSANRVIKDVKMITSPAYGILK